MTIGGGLDCSLTGPSGPPRSYHSQLLSVFHIGELGDRSPFHFHFSFVCEHQLSVFLSLLDTSVGPPSAVLSFLLEATHASFPFVCPACSVPLIFTAFLGIDSSLRFSDFPKCPIPTRPPSSSERVIISNRFSDTSMDIIASSHSPLRRLELRLMLPSSP